MTTFEDEFQILINDKFKDQIRITQESNHFVRLIEEKYPFKGSKIDWKKVKDSLEFKSKGSESFSKESEDFFKKIIKSQSLEPSEEVIVVGDGQFDSTYRLSIETLEKIIKELVDISQHLYLVNENADWVIVFEMEGYGNFGRAST